MTEHNISKSMAWWLAIRPKTLPAAAAPVAVGVAAAIVDGVFQPLPAIAAFFVALLLQIGVNLANDFFDAKNMIDSEERLGPVRVTQSGLIPPGQVKAAMVACLLLSSLIFCYLALAGGLVLLIVGLVSVVAALAYSGGPYPLASNALGELFVFIFFGLVAVCATYWVQALTISSMVLAASVVPGFLVTAIMVVNNLRDRETDKKAGKFTLAVRIGKQRTILLYRALLAGAYLTPLIFLLVGWAGYAVLLPFLCTPLAVVLMGEIGRMRGSDLNATLAKTAQLSFLFSFLFAVGLIL